MSVPFDPKIIARRSDADLTASPWRMVIAVGDNDTDIAGDNGNVIGILTDDVKDGSSTAAFNAVQVGGIGKVKCGGDITAGVSFKADSSGDAVSATADNDICMGYMLEDAADGDVKACLIARHVINVA